MPEKVSLLMFPVQLATGYKAHMYMPYMRSMDTRQHRLGSYSSLALGRHSLSGLLLELWQIECKYVLPWHGH